MEEKLLHVCIWRENYEKLIENDFLLKCALIKIFLSMYIHFRPTFYKTIV